MRRAAVDGFGATLRDHDDVVFGRHEAPAESERGADYPLDPVALYGALADLLRHDEAQSAATWMSEQQEKKVPGVDA